MFVFNFNGKNIPLSQLSVDCCRNWTCY